MNGNTALTRAESGWRHEGFAEYLSMLIWANPVRQNFDQR